MHELLLAFHQRVKIVKVLKVSNDLISLENTVLSGERGLISREWERLVPDHVPTSPC